MQNQAGGAATRSASSLGPPLIWDGTGDARRACDLLTHKAVEFALKVVVEHQAGSREPGLPQNGDGKWLTYHQEHSAASIGQL